jgi:hypothetical protein
MNIWKDFLSLTWWGKAIIIIIFLGIIGAIFDVGDSTLTPQEQTTQVESPATNSETVSPQEETMPDEPKLTFRISGDNGNTAPFALNAGNYKVEFTTYKKCFYGGDLESVDGSISESLLNTMEIGSGETYLYNLIGKDYYISMITGGGCKWDITFTQQ